MPSSLLSLKGIDWQFFLQFSFLCFFILCILPSHLPSGHCVPETKTRRWWRRKVDPQSFSQNNFFLEKKRIELMCFPFSSSSSFEPSSLLLLLNSLTAFSSFPFLLLVLLNSLKRNRQHFLLLEYIRLILLVSQKKDSWQVKGEQREITFGDKRRIVHLLISSLFATVHLISCYK